MVINKQDKSKGSSNSYLLLFSSSFNDCKEPNDIDLLNEKIISQKKNILYLKSRLGNYNNIKKEISRLNQELNKVDEAIKIKNDIISEYQLLSEITKNKFANYINKSDSKLKEYNKKMLNIPDLQK